MDRVYIFNRWASIYAGGFGGSSTGGANAPRLSTATITMRNWYNETVFSSALSGAAPFAFVRATLATPSNSPTPTGSMPASPSGTALPTPDVSASLAAGVSPSGTASASSTATVAPVAVPISIRIRTEGGQILNFVEVIAYSPSGQLLTLNTTSTVTSSNPVTDPTATGNDFCFDAWTAGACAPFIGGDAPGTFWQVTFNRPSPIGLIYFVNRVGTNVQARITTMNSYLEIINQDGTIAWSQKFSSSASVQTFNPFNVAVAAPTPDPADDIQTSAYFREIWTRYIRIDGNATQYLNFKVSCILTCIHTYMIVAYFYATRYLLFISTWSSIVENNRRSSPASMTAGPMWP